MLSCWGCGWALNSAPASLRLARSLASCIPPPCQQPSCTRASGLLDCNYGALPGLPGPPQGDADQGAHRVDVSREAIEAQVGAPVTAAAAHRFSPPYRHLSPTHCIYTLCSFNRREEDFATKQEYDDYLEEREDISETCCCSGLPSSRPSAALMLSVIPNSPAPPHTNTYIHTHSPLPRHAVFNMAEGIDVKEMERRVEEYRRTNADSIIRNEALRAEELRRRVAAAEEGAGQAGLSGTAAAFHEGADAEPHQGMEYTAALPEAAAAALGT